MSAAASRPGGNLSPVVDPLLPLAALRCAVFCRVEEMDVDVRADAEAMGAILFAMNVPW
jgi:hypothetical protein